jgi:hypothetical protein
LDRVPKRAYPGQSSKKSLSWTEFQKELILDRVPKRAYPGQSSKKSLSWTEFQKELVPNII